MNLINKSKEEHYTLPGKIASTFMDGPAIKMTGQKEPVMKYREEFFIEKDFFENIDRAVQRLYRTFRNGRENSQDKT